MPIWSMLLITLLVAVLLGCIVGVVLGKHQVKKASGNYRPLLSRAERVVYLFCLAAGFTCIMIGIFYHPTPAPDDLGMEGGPGMEGELLPGGEFDMEILPDNEILPDEETIPQEDDAADEGGAADETEQPAETEEAVDEAVDAATENVQVEAAVPATPATGAPRRASGGSVAVYEAAR